MNSPRIKAKGPKNCKLAFVGMAPGNEEVRLGEPFVGPAGRQFNHALRTLGISRDEVFITNVSEVPLTTVKSLFDLPRDFLNMEISRLKLELDETTANCIVPLGDEPLQIICGRSEISKWRGSILESTLCPGRKCIPSFHPAWILRGNWKWLSVFTHVDIKRAMEESETPQIVLPRRDAIIGPSFNDAVEFLRECEEKKYIGFDIETRHREIACVGFGFEPNSAMCIPLIRSTNVPYWTDLEEVKIWESMTRVLQSQVKKIAQNASFEWLYFWTHGVFPSNLYIDTMTLHHCLYPDFGITEDQFGRKKRFDEPGHGLGFINSQYTKTPYYKDDGRNWSPKTGDDVLWNYNCLDVMTTVESSMKMKDEADAAGLWDFYQNFYIKPFPHALRMEWQGTELDPEATKVAKDELQKRSEELQVRIVSSVGQINVNSPKQVADLLYKMKGYKPKKDRKTGRITADADALLYFATKYQDQSLMDINELRSVNSLLSKLMDKDVSEDGRIRTHYRFGGTDGARWSSTESILGASTNLQNVKREGVARTIFVPSE